MIGALVSTFVLTLGFILWAIITKRGDNKFGAGLFAVLFLSLFLLLIVVEASHQERERLKQEYPILAEAIYERELKEELETLLEYKQINDKRYYEIIKELK